MLRKTGKIKRKFSSFNEKEAMKLLNIEILQKWEIPILEFSVSDFFYERLRRLDNFGVTKSEGGKEILIEAFCEEALEHHKNIRLWKQVKLESEDLTGIPDYLATKKRDYVENPFLCVVEAKKDNFEKGLAQCLVEMKACRWNNEKDGQLITVYGIVTSGEGWKFYKYDCDDRVFESELLASSDEAKVLGALSYIFSKCEENL